MEASFMQGQFQDGTESGFLRDAILLLTLVRLNSILREYLLSAHRWTQTTSCLWLLMWVCHEIPDYIIYILQLLYEYCICILYHIMNLHSNHGFPIFRDKSTIYMVLFFWFPWPFARAMFASPQQNMSRYPVWASAGEGERCHEERRWHVSSYLEKIAAQCVNTCR